MPTCKTCRYHYECTELLKQKVKIGCINKEKYKPNYEALEKEKELLKEALMAACEKISKHLRCCPAELVCNFDQYDFGCNQGRCDNENSFSDCWNDYFIKQVKEAREIRSGE
jgi:hypothetical protein